MKGVFPQCENCQCRGASLFAGCSMEELLEVSSGKSCTVYKKGQVIFHEGNKPFGVFCIYEGKVKISRIGSEGKEKIIRLAKPGDSLGYRAAISQGKYSASAIALEDAKVCFVSYNDFKNLIANNPKVAGDVMNLFSKALMEAEGNLVNMAFKPVRERVAEALLLLERTYRTDDESNFSISISREDLASLVGTAKETVIRMLSEFKDEGLISSKGSEITLLNTKKLLAISQLYD